MDEAQASRRRQELKEEGGWRSWLGSKRGGFGLEPTALILVAAASRCAAYYLVLKALILRDKPDMTLLAKLRLELSIGTDVHKQWMTELLRAKNAGTLAIHVDDRPGFKQQTISAMPAMGNQRANVRQQQQQMQQQQPSQQQQQPAQQQAAGRTKPKAEEDKKDELPGDPLYLKVQYYRTSEGWAEGVITEFNPVSRKIKVNVLQTKKVEWLDYVPSPCLIVHANARVSDLTQYV